MLLIDCVETLELINNPLNLVLLYYLIVDKLKTEKANVIGNTVLFVIVIWCLKALLARVLTTFLDSRLCN